MDIHELRCTFTVTSAAATHADRELETTPSGEIVCHNELFQVKKNGTGVGMKMFAEQVKNMQAAGVSRIDTTAARNDRPGGAMADCRLQGLAEVRI